MYKLFILNPSNGFNMSWKLALPYLSPAVRQKVFLLKKSQYVTLLEDIDRDQLLKKYGGSLDYPSNFWPIPNTLHKDSVPQVDPKAANDHCYDPMVNNPNYSFLASETMTDDCKF